MRTTLVAGIAVLFAIVGAVPARAEEIAPGGGNAFGQHVASMAPEHAIAHGVDFGQCVSSMARTGTCPH